jgi:hypothetical protein
MPKTRANPELSAVPAAPPTARRWVVLLAFLLVVLAGVLVYGGAAWILLLTDLILEGCYLAFWLAAAMLAGWFVIDRAGLVRQGVAKSLLACTAAAVGLGVIGLLTLGLGLLGWLNRGTAVGMLVILALPQLVRLRNVRPDVRGSGSSPRRSSP